MTYKEFKTTETYKAATKRLYTINADSKETYLVENIMDKNNILDNAIIIGTGCRSDGTIEIDMILE